MFGTKAEVEGSLTKSFTLDFVEGGFTDLAKTISLAAQGVCWRSMLFVCMFQRTRGGGEDLNSQIRGSEVG